jgi:hypothetical protein
MLCENQQTKHLENVSMVVMLIGTLALSQTANFPFVTHTFVPHTAIPLLLLCMYYTNMLCHSNYLWLIF